MGRMGEKGKNEGNGEGCVSVCVYVFFLPISFYLCLRLPASVCACPSLSLFTSYCIYPPVCLSMLISLFLCVSKPHSEVTIYQ